MVPVAGSHLRAESIRSAEEPLAFSPIQKVFGAYLTSLFYVFIGSIFFFGLTAVTVHSLPTVNFSLANMIDSESIQLQTILLMVLQFHLLAFLFAYWINQAVAGFTVAAIIVGSETGIL